MAAVQFEPGTFYVCKSLLVIPAEDCEGVDDQVMLVDGTACRAVRFVRRRGSKGRGKYVQLRVATDEGGVTVFHRISEYNRGAGDWEEMNEMTVLALADVLPLD